MSVPVDSLLSTLSSRTSFAPLISGINNAENARLNAINAAVNQGVGGLQIAAGKLNTGNIQSQQFRQPFIDQGTIAVNRAAGLAGAMTPEEYDELLRRDPALQAIINQGQRAITQSAAATGLRKSGAHLQDLQTFGQEAASKYINDLYGRNLQLAQLGQKSAENQAAQRYDLGAQEAELAGNTGELQANASLAAGDVVAQSAIDRGRAGVAQSTVAGLKEGQIAGSPSSSIPMVNPNATDTWADNKDETYNLNQPGTSSYGASPDNSLSSGNIVSNGGQNQQLGGASGGQGVGAEGGSGGGGSSGSGGFLSNLGTAINNTPSGTSVGGPGTTANTGLSSAAAATGQQIGSGLGSAGASAASSGSSLSLSPTGPDAGIDAALKKQQEDRAVLDQASKMGIDIKPLNTGESLQKIGTRQMWYNGQLYNADFYHVVNQNGGIVNYLHVPTTPYIRQ